MKEMRRYLWLSTVSLLANMAREISRSNSPASYISNQASKTFQVPSCLLLTSLSQTALYNPTRATISSMTN